MMKKMRHTPFMLLAALAIVASCTQGELPDSPSAMSQTLEIASATIARAEGGAAMTTDAGTGTVDGNWVEGDEITVLFMGNNTTATYEYRNGGFTSDNPLDCNGQTSYADAWTNYGVTLTTNNRPGKWKVQEDQSGEGYRHSDFLFTSTGGPVGTDMPANFIFWHQTAKIVVHVRNSGIVAGKTGLSMTVGDGNIYVNGILDDVIDNMYEWGQGDTQGTITPYNLGQQPMSDGNTSLVSFGALVIPQTLTEGLRLFAFTVDGQTYYHAVPTGGITWNAATQYTYNVTIGSELKVDVESGINWNQGNSGSGSITLP